MIHLAQAFKSFFQNILQNRLKTRTQIGILGKNDLSHKFLSHTNLGAQPGFF